MRLFKVKTVNSIRKILTEKFPKILKVETVNIINSSNYFLAEDIFSSINVPLFNKSRVDGYAVFYEDCKIASEASPSLLNYVGQLNIGEENKIVLKENECMYIPTGGMLPENANAMVMIEYTETITDTMISINKSVTKNENITFVGDDIKKDSLVAKKGTLIDGRLIAVLASLGILQVKVFKKPTVFILSSGDELVSMEELICIGQTREINSMLIEDLVKKYNFTVLEKKLIKDDKQEYKKALQYAIDKYKPDIIITSGGSSKGDKDYTVPVFEELSDNVFCEGIGLKPGKPTILAEKENMLFLGLPGHPVSSYMVLRHIILESFMSTIGYNNNKFVFAKLLHNVANNQGREKIMFVKIVIKDNEFYAEPIYYSSTNIGVLSYADGYFSMSETLEGVFKGDMVEVYLL